LRFYNLEYLEKLLLVLNPTKTNLEDENRGYRTIGQSGIL
jgi:hypothetical protein